LKAYATYYSVPLDNPSGISLLHLAPQKELFLVLFFVSQSKLHKPEFQIEC